MVNISPYFHNHKLHNVIENCGITQISAQLFCLCPHSVRKENKTTAPYINDIIITEKFNDYIKPPQTAEWVINTSRITGMHANHPSILAADPIETVWKRFVGFINKYIKKGTRGVLVAWNGNSCDFSWL